MTVHKLSDEHMQVVDWKVLQIRIPTQPCTYRLESGSRPNLVLTDLNEKQGFNNLQAQFSSCIFVKITFCQIKSDASPKEAKKLISFGDSNKYFIRTC